MNGSLLVIGQPALFAALCLIPAWNHPKDTTRETVRWVTLLCGLSGGTFTTLAFSEALALYVGLLILGLWVAQYYFGLFGSRNG